MNGIRRIVSDHSSKEAVLPLVHTSSSKNLPRILVSHKLKAKRCPVYKEKLVYLFYGRPAYRYKLGKTPSNPISVLPICFVFLPYRYRSRFGRVLATDSGGVAKGFCKPELDKRDLPSLGLVATIESAQKLVSLVYQTNANYFDGRPKSSIPEFFGTVGEKLHKHLLKLRNNGDDRKSAIEIQSRQGISLKRALWGIVLPGEVLENNDALKAAIKNVWKCEVFRYRFARGTDMPEYFGIVRQKVADLLEARKLL